MAEGGENSRDERRNRGGERAASSLNSDDVCQIVEALMAGGLAHSINKTVKRQAELAVGDLYVRANTRAEESVEKRDFAVMLEELVARRKEAAESITAYYHSKLELCDRVDVRGTRAVSVIIRGLPEDLRANAYAAQCATPGELYGSFLAGVESHGEEGHRRSVWSRITLPSVASGSRRDEPQAIRRCYNCQKYTAHLSKNCPAPVAERCAICGDRSHMKADCPRRRTQQQASYKRSAIYREDYFFPSTMLRASSTNIFFILKVKRSPNISVGTLITLQNEAKSFWKCPRMDEVKKFFPSRKSTSSERSASTMIRASSRNIFFFISEVDVIRPYLPARCFELHRGTFFFSSRKSTSSDRICQHDASSFIEEHFFFHLGSQRPLNIFPT